MEVMKQDEDTVEVWCGQQEVKQEAVEDMEHDDMNVVIKKRLTALRWRKRKSSK